MRTHIFSSAVLALSFFIPVLAQASVFINEVAWMGTAVSASDEWIELYNDGTEEVSLSGWRLEALDGAPAITLSGAISANGYYLLERTDDMTVPDIVADKIYTGDLGNTGETLKLLDANGVVIDTATGGSNWMNIGGNNTTKDTPQRQTDGTWLTGISTPKALNTTVASETPGGEVAGAGTSTTPTSARKRTITGGYKQIVFGYAGENLTGIAGITLTFKGFAVSDKNVLLPAARYRWSFGDGTRKQGRHITHAYEEPGTYTIVLHVADEEQQWRDTITATILPATVTIAAAKAGERGYIEIQNNGDVEIDLSNWKLRVLSDARSKNDTFTLPATTIIAPHTSVRFASRVTGFVLTEKDIVEVRYPSGVRASKFFRDHLVATSSVEIL